MSKRPNVLLFFTDDQRFDTISALGNSEIQTPNLDALVASGTTFTRAHIPGGTCGAVCMPSRAMLHTGRTLFHIDREGQDVPQAHTTMGECLRGAGYETFGTGKWHNGRSAYARSFTSGDEIMLGGMGDHWNVPAYHFDPEGNYDSRLPYVRNPQGSNEVEYRQCDHVHPGVHSTDLFADAATRFLGNRDGGNPFFLYISLMAPHDPRTMPDRFLKMYDPSRIQLPESFLPEHPIDTGALRIRDELLAAFPRTPEEIRRHIAEYYAMITHLDDALGRLIGTLRDSGDLENTIVVFAGDNGLALGRHGLMGKQSLYDHSVRVPLIFSGPGIPRDQSSDALVYLLDIYPTLCDLAGIGIPESVEGDSLSECFASPNASMRDQLYLAYGDSIRGVSDGSHKLIEYACGETQLFDLGDDPHEMHSLADGSGAETKVDEMRTSLVRLRDEWDDPGHPTGERFWDCRKDLHR